jgi:hypothetical protein
MCPDALHPQRAPWCPFNQARSRDFALQSLTEQRSPKPLDFSIPSCDWLSPCRVKQTFKPTHEHLPAIALPLGLGHRTRRRNVPSLADHRRHALSAHEALLHSAASLQGFEPSARLGDPSLDFSACEPLALVGFCLLGAFPFPWPWTYKPKHKPRRRLPRLHGPCR